MSLSRRAALAPALLVLSLSTAASAHTVFLSSDSNLGNAIDGSELFAPIDPGNKVFFQNILQGGSKVVILTDHIFGSGSSLNAINTFYNTLPGVTSSFDGPLVSPATLFQADLLIISTPGDDFTPGEIGSMADFLSGGNSILFMGENGGFYTHNAIINATLASLGIGMTIVDSIVDPGFHTVSGSRIVTDPFTAGVNTFTYAGPSEIALGAHGKGLFLTSNLTPVVAYVTVPEPSIMALAIAGVAGGLTFRQRTRYRRKRNRCNPNIVTAA